MKKQICTAVASVVLMAGCQIKTIDDQGKISDDMNRKNQETLDKMKFDLDQLLSPLYYGGQPGKITVKGIIVRKTGEEPLLDDRIQVEQVGGKGVRGITQTLVSNDNKAVLSDSIEDIDLSSALASGKFINLGCENLTTEETAGLTEDSSAPLDDSTMSLVAKKIFVCGSPQLTHFFVTFKAEQIILKNATLRITNMTGRLSLYTAKLALEGENIIETQGADAKISVLQAPPLDFAVTQAIDGDGKLTLRSVGGNCVEGGPN